MEILTVKNLSFTYPGGAAPALSDVSFSVNRGDFAVLCGQTASGKSTLLRLLKRELIPQGGLSGEIFINGQPQSALDGKQSACSVGYVAQRPEQQLVTDRVYHELAFGLENMGLPSDAIRCRVAEIASYFGLEELFEQPTAQLSGGQKQLLNLAAVAVMQPEILLLDEPTSQLDPIAAADFIAAVQRLNRDFSLTVIFAEHRLSQVLPVSDKLLVLGGGRLAAYGTTRETVKRMTRDPSSLEAMPAAVRLFSRLDSPESCPLTVSEGRAFIENGFCNKIRSLPLPEYVHSKTPALEFSDVFFRYGRDLPDILRGLTLKVYENELFCILGGNGSGKSTALSAAAGLLKPYAGNIKIFGKRVKDYNNQSLYRGCLSLLPQDVQTVFLKNTVKEELAEAGAEEKTELYDLSPLAAYHPYDLSGGQQQLLALAKVLASKPRLLLLDEPTKGLDARFRHQLTRFLKKLRDTGVTVLAVTHDVEFACELSDRCAMFFRGEITSCGVPRRFFSSNAFYTTEISRMTRGFYDLCCTEDDALTLCLENGARTE